MTIYLIGCFLALIIGVVARHNVIKKKGKFTEEDAIALFLLILASWASVVVCMIYFIGNLVYNKK